MTFSEAGFLSSLIAKKKYQENVSNYNLNPKLCLNCNIPIEYKKRINKYCSRSCAATRNNTGIRRHGCAPSLCIRCKSKCDNHKSKFCSRLCDSLHRKEQRFEKIKELGVGIGTTSTKNYLIYSRGHTCEICKNSSWMGKNIPLIMDHINGNSEDNSLANLRLVCGNCEMQLPTYKSKNKNSGRFYRRQRYKEGKSF